MIIDNQCGKSIAFAGRKQIICVCVCVFGKESLITRISFERVTIVRI